MIVPSRQVFFSAATGLLCALLDAGLRADTITVTEPTVVPVAGCSLSDAVASANTNMNVGLCVRVAVAGADVIDFDPGVVSPIVLAAALPVITDDVAVTGPGAAVLSVDANSGAFPVFAINSAANIAVTITGLTIRGSTASGINVAAGDTLTLVTSDVVENDDTGTVVNGGGIVNAGTLILDGARVGGNAAVRSVGGGIANTGTLDLIGGSIVGGFTDGSGNLIAGNTAATHGAGILNGGGVVNITDSQVRDNNATMNGGGIYNNTGSVTVTNSTIGPMNNAAGNGGGIYNNIGSVTITNSTIGPINTATDGGGIYHNDPDPINTVQLTAGSVVLNNIATGNGGGIYNVGVLALDDTTLQLNLATLGGGIYNVPFASATLTLSALDQNTALNHGGGIYSLGGVSLSDSVATANLATNNGGAINNNDGSVTVRESTIGPGNGATNGAGIFNDGTLNVVNSTISGNPAPGGAGGGMFLNSGLTNLRSATVTDNTAFAAPGGGGIHMDVAALLNITNSIVAGNTDSSGAGNDCSGTMSSLGYNLIGDTTGTAGCLGTIPATDLVDQNALLDTLADNGGPTPTHALQPGSPTIDTADPIGCVDHNAQPLFLDQRGTGGNGRHLDGDGDGALRCDMGAFETVFVVVPVPDIEVTDSWPPADDLHIDFGDVDPGDTSAPGIVTVANVGTADLTVSSMQLSGADATDFQLDLQGGAAPCGGGGGLGGNVIAPGSSCTVAVSFAPQSAASSSASLDIACDDPDEGTVTVTLGGIDAADSDNGGSSSLATSCWALLLLMGLAGSRVRNAFNHRRRTRRVVLVCIEKVPSPPGRGK